MAASGTAGCCLVLRSQVHCRLPGPAPRDRRRDHRVRFRHTVSTVRVARARAADARPATPSNAGGFGRPPHSQRYPARTEASHVTSLTACPRCRRLSLEHARRGRRIVNLCQYTRHSVARTRVIVMHSAVISRSLQRSFFCSAGWSRMYRADRWPLDAHSCSRACTSAVRSGSCAARSSTALPAPLALWMRPLHRIPTVCLSLTRGNCAHRKRERALLRDAWAPPNPPSIIRRTREAATRKFSDAAVAARALPRWIGHIQHSIAPLIAVQKVLTGGLRAAAFVRLHGSRSGSGRGGGRERQRTGAATGCADLDVGACRGGSNWV